jgi:predicted transcriptional regulator
LENTAGCLTTEYNENIADVEATMKTSIVTIRLEPDLLEQLNKIGAALQRPVAQLGREALRAFVEKYQPKTPPAPLDDSELWRQQDEIANIQTVQRWTQEEAVAYECAREVITHLRAILTGEIADEESKPVPDVVRLKSLRAEWERLFHERANLHVDSHKEVARVRKEYGARVRAWMAAEA